MTQPLNVPASVIAGLVARPDFLARYEPYPIDVRNMAGQEFWMGGPVYSPAANAVADEPIERQVQTGFEAILSGLRACAQSSLAQGVQGAGKLGNIDFTLKRLRPREELELSDGRRSVSFAQHILSGVAPAQVLREITVTQKGMIHFDNAGKILGADSRSQKTYNQNAERHAASCVAAPSNRRVIFEHPERLKQLGEIFDVGSFVDLALQAGYAAFNEVPNGWRTKPYEETHIADAAENESTYSYNCKRDNEAFGFLMVSGEHRFMAEWTLSGTRIPPTLRRLWDLAVSPSP